MTAAPIILDFKSASSNSAKSVSLTTFDSYQFQRSFLTPAAPFRFTAPGVDPDLRQAIRSGDMVTLWVVPAKGSNIQIATGFIDETDTHVTPQRVEYVLSGRDTVGQLVDNASIDNLNNIVNVTKLSIEKILENLIQNTRIPPGYKPQQTPNAQLLFQTNPGETKINALQRYLEFTNCLIWSQPNGQLVIGKPDFAQEPLGILALNSTGTGSNNVLEVRVRRAPNLALRKTIAQLSTLSHANSGQFTVNNNDQDVVAIAGAMAGRSNYTVFSYGSGTDAINQVTQIGNQSGSPNAIGASLARREIARENMKVLDVEMVVKGHTNDKGVAFNIDQMYNVQISDDDVNEDMMVYDVSFELTLEHGMITRLQLCRKGTICADSAILSGGVD